MDTDSDLLGPTVNCDSLPDLIDSIFSAPPPDPHRYELKIDGAQSAHDIFRSLGLILTHGMVYLWGENIRVGTLTADQIQTMQEYLHAFGWKAVINPTGPQDHPEALPHMLSLPNNDPGTFVNVVFEPFR